MPPHLIGVDDMVDDLPALLAAAARLKADHRAGRGKPLLKGRAAVLLFEKHSTRTRVSLEVGLARLGMTTVFLTPRDIQLGRGETLEDTALVLSRYADILFHRALSRDTVEGLAHYAHIPVVNALDDAEHPLQALADYLTLRERFGRVRGLTVSWIGDGNNVAASFVLAGAALGCHVRIATPEGYALPAHVVEAAKVHAHATGGSLTLAATPIDAVQGTHAVATDTWVSMGDEAEEAARLAAFAGWTIDDALLDAARDDVVFLHCLPAHYGHEVVRDVAHGPRSAVFDEAENRMWTQMAVAVWLLAPDAFQRLAMVTSASRR